MPEHLASRILVLVALSACLAGCAGYSHVRYAPNPLDVRLARSEDAPSEAHALVAVRGIRRADDGGWELALRLRLENEARGELVFLPESCELLDAALEPFPPPRAARREETVGDPFRLAPASSGTFDLVFPFPAERAPSTFDLEGLSLRWTIEVGGARMRVSSTFERLHYDPGYRFHDCHPWLGFHYHASFVHPYWR